MDAEERFSTSSVATSYFASEYFEHPALYRVLFMGSTTKVKKNELLLKLSQGFVHVLDPSDKPPLRKPILPFKEVKHNAILLNDDEDELLSDICEDYGVSIIEADFTWNSNAVNYSRDPNQLLLQYAWNQCPNPRELPSAWLEAQLTQTDFQGQMYAEKTPNGIDLCVYFYDGPAHDERTSQDLHTLCILRKLGIYVLPLTNTRDEAISTHFADLLTRSKVRCLDLGNLEVGQEPSFFHQRQSTADRISRLQGMECTQSNIPRVAPYQVVAVEQFCGIENKAVFKLLKRTRERQVIRDELKEELARLKSFDPTPPLPPPSPLPPPQLLEPPNRKFFSLKWILPTLCLSVLWILYQPTFVPWEATFSVTPNRTFILSTRNTTGHLAWSELLPSVWLNDQHLIPVQRQSDQIGTYTLHTPSLDNLSVLVFSINSTEMDYRQLNTPIFVLLDPPATSPLPSIMLEKEMTRNMNRTEEEKKETQDEDRGFLKACWNYVVFLANNPISKIKVLTIE